MAPAIFVDVVAKGDGTDTSQICKKTTGRQSLRTANIRATLQTVTSNNLLMMNMYTLHYINLSAMANNHGKAPVRECHGVFRMNSRHRDKSIDTIQKGFW